MKTWQEKSADLAVTITAGMLLASGTMMVTIGQQQARITTQVESVIEKLNVLTGNIKELDGRVRFLEINR